MIDDFKKVFELAKSATVFIKEIMKLKPSNKNSDEKELVLSNKGNYAQIGSSGDSARIGSSGDYARIGSSGDYAQIGSSGYSARIGSSGNSARIGSSGDSARIGSSGNSAQIGSSGNYAQIGSSGNYAQIGSSGNYAQIGSSGDYAQIGSSGNSARIGSSGDSARIGSSGNSARIGSSGDSAQIDSTGSNSVVAGIGIKSIVKAAKGSWITLAEYRQNENGNWIVDFVKTEQVDGKIIKEDTYYTLYNHQFVEVQIIDDVKTIILQCKKNVMKGLFLNSLTPCYVVEKDGVYAHGATLEEAKDSLIYKITDRDKSDYEDYTLDTEVTYEEAIKMYRIITGACEMGTRNFVENVLAKKKKKYTVREVIKLTEGQYGNQTLKEFMENK